MLPLFTQLFHIIIILPLVSLRKLIHPYLISIPLPPTLYLPHVGVLRIQHYIQNEKKNYEWPLFIFCTNFKTLTTFFLSFLPTFLQPWITRPPPPQVFKTSHPQTALTWSYHYLPPPVMLVTSQQYFSFEYVYVRELTGPMWVYQVFCYVFCVKFPLSYVLNPFIKTST